MRVLQVVPYYAPAWAYGGPPKVMWEEARELARRGHQITAFTTDSLDACRRVPGPLVQRDTGVEIHRFRNLSNRLAYHQYRFTPRGFFRALRHVQADIVHLSEIRHELAIGAWRAARRRSIPIAVSAHGTLPRRAGVKAAARVAYDAAFVTPMLKAAFALFAQTRHELEAYKRFGVRPERLHLLPLGTDAPPPPGRYRLDVPDDVPVILFLGRIHPLKGVDRLVKAFARIASRHPEAHLAVVGRDDGALLESKAIADRLGVGRRVVFPGPIYGVDRYDAYRRASVFAIMPNHYEETSLASLEAASVGTPLVIGAEAEAPFLEEYGAGFTVPEGADPAEALDMALESNLVVMGKCAERMVDERHLWPVVGEQLEAVLLGEGS